MTDFSFGGQPHLLQSDWWYRVDKSEKINDLSVIRLENTCCNVLTRVAGICNPTLFKVSHQQTMRTRILLYKDGISGLLRGHKQSGGEKKVHRAIYP